MFVFSALSPESNLVQDDVKAPADSIHVRLVSFQDRNRSILARSAEQFAITIGIFARAVSVRPTPDVIVVTIPALPLAFAAWALSKIHRVPYVLDLRDAWPDLIDELASWDQVGGSVRKRFVSNGLIRVASWIARPCLNAVIQNADSIVTTSRYLEHSLRQKGIQNVTTVLNAPAGRLPENRVSRFTLEEKQQGDALRVVYAGTIGRAQGLANFVEGVGLAIGDGVPIDARLYGDGAEKAWLRAIVQERGLEHSIQVCDAVPRCEVEALYEWADLALVHLRDWEPLRRTIPSKLIELMDRKKPVLLVAQGESADIVEATGAGIVVPPGNPDALRSALVKIAKNGRILVNEEKVSSWVDEHANPMETTRVFADIVEAYGR